VTLDGADSDDEPRKGNQLQVQTDAALQHFLNHRSVEVRRKRGAQGVGCGRDDRAEMYAASTLNGPVPAERRGRGTFSAI
jgi:hypothetical protein